jgi:hypothetical protein
MANFKYGKKSPKRLMSTPALGDFLPKATEWPAVPAQGWESAVPSSALNVLGNDVYGDCAEAGALGLIQAMSYNAGRPLIPTTQDALNLYSAVTGFNPNAPLVNGQNPTDQGTALTDLLTYWQKTGITVGTTVHKIIGFASLDITSIPQMRYATYLFGGSYLGINCPESAEQDTSNWTYQAGSPIVGGHCVVRVGEGAAGGKTRSWGMFIPTANDFYLNYLDEGYVVVTEDFINAQGKSPSNIDINGLLAAMKAI